MGGRATFRSTHGHAARRGGSIRLACPTLPPSRGSFGEETVANILSGDSLLFTAILVAAGLLLDAKLLLGLPVTISGAIIAMIDPAHAPHAFTTSTILLIVAGAVYVGLTQGGSRR